MKKEQIKQKAKDFVSKRASGTPKEMDCYSDMLTEFATEVTKELEKENVELKKRVDNQKSFLERIRAKFELGELEKKEIEGYLESEQLTKAKEIIKKFLLWENDWHNKTESKYELLKQAEQFLNSEVEK